MIILRKLNAVQCIHKVFDNIEKFIRNTVKKEQSKEEKKRKEKTNLHMMKRIYFDIYNSHFFLFLFSILFFSFCFFLYAALSSFDFGPFFAWIICCLFPFVFFLCFVGNVDLLYSFHIYRCICHAYKKFSARFHFLKKEKKKKR